ncbi:MAG: type 4a pilus biogenesis protein PilO [Patescibacteria group bacterium]
MRRDNKTSFLALTIFAVGVCFYLSFSLIIPGYKQNRRDYYLAKSEIESARAKLESLKTAKQSMSDLGAIVDQMLVAVPEGTGKEDLIVELEAIAAKHNTYIPSIQISDNTAASSSTAAATPGAIQISFSVKGSFTELNQFITSLEKSIRFMNIKSLSLSEGDNGLSLSLQIEAYRRAGVSPSVSASGVSEGGV